MMRLSICAGVLTASVLLLAGCSFTVPVSVLSDVVLPGVDSTLPEGMPQEWIDLVANWEGVGEPRSLGELCGFSDLGALLDNVDEEAEDDIQGSLPLFLSWVRVTEVSVQNVQLRARSGDFSSLNRVRLEMWVDGSEEAVYEAEEPDGFGETIDMAALKTYNLTELFGDSEVNCIEHFLGLQGGFPQEDVRFDLRLYIRVRYRLGLF